MCYVYWKPPLNSRAAKKSLEGCMLPAGRTLAMPDLEYWSQHVFKSSLEAQNILCYFNNDISTVVKFFTFSNAKSQQHLCPKVLILDLISFESLDLDLFLNSVLTSEKFLVVSKFKSQLLRNSSLASTNLANTYVLKFQFLTCSGSRFLISTCF